MDRFIKVYGKTREQRREELAKQIYGKSYSDCCWKQKDALNSRITIENEKYAQEVGVGG